MACNNPALPPETKPLTITCPAAPVPAVGANGQGAAVSFGNPTITGGTAPVSAACAPASGAVFPIGSTTVTCTATDAVRRTAACSFAIGVMAPAPRLGIKTILAFGDSLTEGEVPVTGEFPALDFRPRYVELAASYPADLTTSIARRYTAQGATRVDAEMVGPDNSTNDCGFDPPVPTTSGIVIVNAGCLGERAAGSSTLARLNDKIAMYHPDAVLLLEGTNDLDASTPETSVTSVASGVQGVKTLIQAIRSQGLPVFVSTLLPEIQADLTHGGSPSLVCPFNAQLRPIAISNGARLVDLYTDISTDVTDWISPFDGLHPTQAGYQQMARVWFNAIQSAFETPVSGNTSSVRRTVRPCDAVHASPCAR